MKGILFYSAMVCVIAAMALVIWSILDGRKKK